MHTIWITASLPSAKLDRASISALLRYTLSTSNVDFCSEMCMTGFYNDVAGGKAIARTSQDVQLASVCLRECKNVKKKLKKSA